MRVFLGIPLPASLARETYACTSGLRERLPDVKWVRAENYHITVLFLGEIDDSEISRVAGLLGAIDFGCGAGAILGTIGQFPPRGALKVVYAGLAEGGDCCVSVQAMVSSALPEYAERRPYVPHITLGRAKSGRRVVLTRDSGPLPADPFRLEEIVLYRSLLSPAGAEYRNLYSWSFR